MERVVIKIGGSVLGLDAKTGKGTLEYLHELSSILSSLNRYAFAFVVGGGRTAKDYVGLARGLGLSAYDQDLLAIDATRMNARLVARELGASHMVCKTVDEARTLFELGIRPIMGGTVPGHTTNAVAALLSEAIGARLVNLTNVDGVYDSDPRKNPNAKKFGRMSHAQLVELAAAYDKRGARENFVFDILASKIIARSNIETHIVDGRDLEMVKNAIQGKEHNGTVVID